MSGLGELDRPGAPGGAEAWDERSGEWVATPEGAAASAVSEEAHVPAPSRRPNPRRTGADPVKALMHRHRELCARAVDPLEIAAGLEAHGVTDRTATRFRHRDVFSLAEEMYARAAHDEETAPRPTTPTAIRTHTSWILLTLLPGALCAATVAALRLTHGRAHAIALAVGVLAGVLALRAALARGPLAPTDGTPPGSARHASGSSVWTCWLLAYALLGDGLLDAAVAGGPDGPPGASADSSWTVATAPVLALSLACAPAAWCAHLFAVSARRRLDTSRGLEEFTASARPLLLGAFALFLSALSALLAVCGVVLGESAAYAQTVTLGALLLLARLLTAHGFHHAPAIVLAAAAAAEATALATVFAGRLPGCGFLATPVETAVDAWGPGSIPALACAAAATALLVHATRTLTRASAHAPADRPC
ncbi:hypothetical protein [Streptomyces spinosisporus]|jgi:hypothetical protein|uniref:Integral membrane protein n=1 Tax=Streptomyces spinosisporus TaxID=2927582 RepID=A0ABS9XLR5_9ACTN|nr:hypothetical protein [Streptomyces spinosisporus]MCI3243004.1 hypothetical protein [Streptomyces spinosisporus]